MADERFEGELYVPVHGNVLIYPNGLQDSENCRKISAPAMISIRAGDQFGFVVGGVSEVVDEDLKQLADVLAPISTRLCQLRMGGCQRVTDRGLAQVIRFTGLEHLSAGGLMGVSRRGWNMLEKLTCLTRLDLESTANVSDDTAQVISRLNQLEDINLDLCPNFTDVGIERLCARTSLTTLGLNAAKVTDRGVRAIAQLTRLKGLTLPTDRSECRITDRSLALLSELPDLVYLTLPDCSGFLRRLFTGSGISHKALERFFEAKPDCDVWTREIHAERMRMLAAASE